MISIATTRKIAEALKTRKIYGVREILSLKCLPIIKYDAAATAPNRARKSPRIVLIPDFRYCPGS